MPRLARRTLLGMLASAPAAAPGAAFAAPQPRLLAQDVCRVTPELTEGPFYLDRQLVRSDIKDGRAGAPLEIAIQVVTPDCRPIPGARVDLWHADALGAYSAVRDTRGETFLRGTQFADGNGVARFFTIYPGWYAGRSTHMHLKAFPDERTTLTTQIFFPEPISRLIYTSMEPYRRRDDLARQTNARDGIARQGGDAAQAKIRAWGDGFAASHVIGVAREAA